LAGLVRELALERDDGGVLGARIAAKKRKKRKEEAGGKAKG